MCDAQLIQVMSEVRSYEYSFYLLQWLVPHGGLSHLSSLPQQVLPLAVPGDEVTAAATDIIFERSPLPHSGQTKLSPVSPIFVKNSVIVPHRLHRNS